MTDQSPEPAKPAIEAMLGTEKRAIGVIASIATLRMFGLFALLPVLSKYAADLADATPILIGLAVGAYGLTAAGLQIPLGALSDRVGRVPVIAGGLAVFAIGSLVAVFSDTIYGVIAGRLLQGAGAISATLTALIADTTRAEVRTRSMAFLGIGIGLSFLLAMVIGPMLAAKFGVPALFWFGFLAGVIATLLLFLLPKDLPQPEATGRWNLRASMRADLLRLDFYSFMLHSILTASFVALPFLMSNSLELPLTSQWKIYVGALLVSLLGTVPLIIQDERRGKGRTIGIAVSLLLVGELILTFGGFSSTTVFLALAIFFAGFNFLEAGLPARLSLLANEETRGASFGVYSSAQFLGAFTGGLIGGRFLAGGNPGDVFFVCALLAGIWLALQGFGRFRSV